jgi:hypothetical protein
MKDKLITEFLRREDELDRKRTRALATQQWAKVIDIEARISECQIWRLALVKALELEGGPNPHPQNQ